MRPWGAPEGLSGVVVRDPRHLEAELTALPSRREWLTRRDTRVLTLVSPLTRLPPDRSVPGSLFAAGDARGLFSMLALGRNVRTFRSPWSEALYWFLNELVEVGGELILPAAPGRSPKDGDGRAMPWRRCSNSPAMSLTRSSIRLRGRSGLARPSSLLPWFIGDLSGIVHVHLMSRSSSDALRAILREPLAEELHRRRAGDGAGRCAAG